jgi:hypothetical protein
MFNNSLNHSHYFWDRPRRWYCILISLYFPQNCSAYKKKLTKIYLIMTKNVSFKVEISARYTFSYGPEQFNRYSDLLLAGQSGVRIPVRKTFSAPVQNGPPSFHYSGYRVSFPGASCRGVALTTQTNVAPMSKKEYRYSFTPPLGLQDLLQGELYRYLYILSYSLFQ